MGGLNPALDTVTRRLRAESVRPGDRVGLTGTPSPSLAWAILAVWRLGAVAVPLHPRLRPPQVRAALAELGCRCVLDTSAVAAGEPLELGGLTWEGLSVDLAAAGTCLLTSGTTGRPKAVLHGCGRHVASARGAEQQIRFDAADTWWVSLPMAHISGLSLLGRALLHGGALRFAPPGQRLREAVRTVDGVTHLSLVPTQLRDLLDDPTCHAGLARLRAILVGGDHCPVDLLRRSADLGLPVYVTYGSTEMASQVTTAPLNLDGHVGRVLPYRQLRVDAEGRIHVRGETRFEGYWQAGRLVSPFDPDGWFATGDRGRLDAEGRLTVLGRLDNAFITGGENVFPEEIERCLESLPSVRHCWVVPVSDVRYGRRPVAWIWTDGDRRPGRAELLEAVSGLESFRRPDAFLLGSAPLTRTQARQAAESWRSGQPLPAGVELLQARS